MLIVARTIWLEAQDKFWSRSDSEWESSEEWKHFYAVIHLVRQCWRSVQAVSCNQDILRHFMFFIPIFLLWLTIRFFCFFFHWLNFINNCFQLYLCGIGGALPWISSQSDCSMRVVCQFSTICQDGRKKTDFNQMTYLKEARCILYLNQVKWTPSDLLSPKFKIL